MCLTNNEKAAYICSHFIPFCLYTEVLSPQLIVEWLMKIDVLLVRVFSIHNNVAQGSNFK